MCQRVKIHRERRFVSTRRDISFTQIFRNVRKKIDRFDFDFNSWITMKFLLETGFSTYDFCNFSVSNTVTRWFESHCNTFVAIRISFFLLGRDLLFFLFFFFLIGILLHRLSIIVFNNLPLNVKMQPTTMIFNEKRNAIVAVLLVPVLLKQLTKRRAC